MLGAILRDDVCLVIDMECFCVDGVYRCRELGFCSWRRDSGRVAVTPAKRRCHLTTKEKQQVHFLTREIHGLSYTPDKHEFQTASVRNYVHKLYAEFSTEQRRRIAFKGGHVEKDLLVSLNIPFLDLESLGCPKYDLLRLRNKDDVETCGWHAMPNKHHCAMAECKAFFSWYSDYVHPPTDEPMDIDPDGYDADVEDMDIDESPLEKPWTF